MILRKKERVEDHMALTQIRWDQPKQVVVKTTMFEIMIRIVDENNNTHEYLAFTLDSGASYTRGDTRIVGPEAIVEEL